MSLPQSAISYIKKNLNIDFGIFTGDVVEGAIWVEGESAHLYVPLFITAD